MGALLPRTIRARVLLGSAAIVLAFLAIVSIAVPAIARDHEIDVLAARLAADADRATWLLWAAHNLERVGDRIQNICERTVYEVTGVMRELTRQPLEEQDET